MTPVVIIATLVSDDTATAGDIVAHGRSPVFGLCRALLAAGADPNARLECYRGTTLAVVVKSLGRGAMLTIKERNRGGLEIARWEAFPCSPVSPRIRQDGASVQTGAASLPIVTGADGRLPWKTSRSPVLKHTFRSAFRLFGWAKT